MLCNAKEEVKDIFFRKLERTEEVDSGKKLIVMGYRN